MKTTCLIFCLTAVFLAQVSFANAAVEREIEPQANVPSAKNKVIPRIDDEAASTVKPARNATPARNASQFEAGGQSVAGGDLGSESGNLNGNIYSQNFWMLLFGAYLFLLIFNLSFEFGKKKKLQWLWEAILTFLAIYVWDNLDISRSNSWFPGVVLESGIIIYAFYFYFLDKKLKNG
jgi:hypothetical protein